MTATKTIEPTTADYKGHHIEVGISTDPNDKGQWISIITDSQGRVIDDEFSSEIDSTPESAIVWAKCRIDFWLAEKSIAPRFLVFLQEAMTEGFSEEAVMRALEAGSNSYSENGFFEDSKICSTTFF